MRNLGSFDEKDQARTHDGRSAFDQNLHLTHYENTAYLPPVRFCIYR
jgi:hypothetical protein